MTDEACSGSAHPAEVRIIMLMRDTLPAFRSDVAVLFGVALPREGIKTDLIGLSAPGSCGKSLVWSGGAVWPMGQDKPGIRGEFRRLWTDISGLLTHLKSEHDVIQVRDKFTSAVLALIWAKLCKKSFVYWMSYPFVEGYEERIRRVNLSKGLVFFILAEIRIIFARFFCYSVVLRFADHIFVQSDAMLASLTARGVIPVKLTPVPMGIDSQTIFYTNRPAQIPSAFVGRRILVYLGALSQARKSDFLLNVLIAIRHRSPAALLILAGDGDSASESLWIKQRITECRLEDHVILTGWLPQREALSLVACAEIGLSPIPRGELFDVSSPTKVLEYLALGLPCIVNDIPDQKYVIESSGGGLCVNMNVPEFVEAIDLLLADPVRARCMGESGRDWIRKNRSYDVLAKRVSFVYRALAKKS